jgi:hypothetical protein
MGLTNNGVALGRTPLRVSGREYCSNRESGAQAPTVAVLRGRPAIVPMAEMLRQLSHHTGQADSMVALDVLLDAPSSRAKIPHLVLVGLRDGVQPRRATADDLDGAVLLYEYKFAGRGTGAFATDDITGERTVIAPAEIRTEVAETACRTLIARGATVVLISLTGGTDEIRSPETEAEPTCRLATRKRLVPHYLPLAATYEETLATLGNDTRRNFRRYRRRVEQECGAEFIPTVQMEREAFLDINRASTNPLADDMAKWRYDSLARITVPVFCGLRSTDGRWLSLAGGRRTPGILYLDWQLNAAGMPRSSLCTVMRAFLLEYEITQGTRKLMFEGGTPHPMRHSFASIEAVDVIAQRRSARAWTLQRCSRWVLPEKNFLGHTWRDQELNWVER